MLACLGHCVQSGLFQKEHILLAVTVFILQDYWEKPGYVKLICHLYYKTSIRGSGFNDIVITGAFGLIMHYNGISWYNYQDINYITGSYGNITLKRDLIVCTGELNNGKAILTIGKR